MITYQQESPYFSSTICSLKMSKLVYWGDSTIPLHSTLPCPASDQPDRHNNIISTFHPLSYFPEVGFDMSDGIVE